MFFSLKCKTYILPCMTLKIQKIISEIANGHVWYIKGAKYFLFGTCVFSFQLEEYIIGCMKLPFTKINVSVRTTCKRKFP